MDHMDHIIIKSSEYYKRLRGREGAIHNISKFHRDAAHAVMRYHPCAQWRQGDTPICGLGIRREKMTEQI